LRYVSQNFSSTPRFVAFAQATLYRGADLSLVWQPLLAVMIIDSVYFAVARSPFFGGSFLGAGCVPTSCRPKQMPRLHRESVEK
jgi:hypothetical protein